MGQYYHPIILGKNGGIKGYWYSHKIGQGLKLMEHSYLNNPLCNCVENYIAKNGGARLVWAGDYADEERTKLSKEEAKAVWLEKVNKGEISCGFGTFLKSGSPDLFKPKSNSDENLYSLCGKQTVTLPDGTEKIVHYGKPELEYDTTPNDHRFLVCDDKKQFIDLWNVPCVDGYRINPLPLMTVEGNGRGGGDYSGIEEKYVGTWARCFIRLVDGWRANDELVKQGYTEIRPKFCESWHLTCNLRTVTDLILEHLKPEYDYSGDAEFVAKVRFAIETIKAALPAKTANEKKYLEKLQAKAQATA